MTMIDVAIWAFWFLLGAYFMAVAKEPKGE